MKQKKMFFEKHCEKSIHSVCKNWSESSSIHGVSRIFKDGSAIKNVFWALALMSAFSYCIYNLTFSILDYYQYKPNTIISKSNLPQVEFPAVTFCNNNPYNTKGRNFRLGPLIDALNIDIHNETLEKFTFEVKMTALEHQIRIHMSDYDEKIKSEQGFWIDDMLLSCRFSSQECGKDEFVYSYSVVYGNCFTFNSGFYLNGTKTSIRNLSNSGSLHGLRLQLNVGTLPDKVSFVRSEGAVIFIHNSSYSPFNEEPLRVPTGQDTNIGIDQTFITRLQYPFSSCVQELKSINGFNSELYKIIVKEFGIYTQNYCVKYCQESFIEKLCNCSQNSFMQSSVTIRKCSVVSDVDCLTEGYDKFFKDHSLVCYKECQKNVKKFLIILPYPTLPIPQLHILNFY